MIIKLEDEIMYEKLISFLPELESGKVQCKRLIQGELK